MIVQYQGKPLDLRAGDVILFHTPLSFAPMSWLSWAIRKFTQFPYNHSALIVENNGELFINEAIAGGVVARPLEKYLDRDDSIIILRSKQELDGLGLSKKANQELGISYNFKGLIDNAIYRLPKLVFNVQIPWPGHTATFAMSRMVCSQYVAWAHALPEWWTMSSAEVFYSNRFEVIFEQDHLLK